MMGIMALDVLVSEGVAASHSIEEADLMIYGVKPLTLYGLHEGKTARLLLKGILLP